MRKLIFFIMVSAILSGCGGGGSNSSPVNSPLSQYAGNFGVCDGEHGYITFFNRLESDGTLKITPSTNYHNNADCTGPIVGTENWSDGLKARYLTTQIVGVFGVVFMGERRPVDIVDVTTSNIRVTLSGTGVFNNCVAFTVGSYCLPSSSPSFESYDLAFYLENGKDMVILAKNNQDYVLMYKTKRIE